MFDKLNIKICIKTKLFKLFDLNKGQQIFIES